MKRRVFLSYAHTGQDPDVVEPRMRRLVQEFKKHFIDAYCNLDDPVTKGFKNPGEYVAHALVELKKCDAVVAIKASAHKSEGQLMEIGAALAWEKPVWLLMHESARGKTYIDDPDISKQVKYWNTEDDLVAKIEELTQ